MISASIIQTLKYSDHFGFPLTLEEIYLRLIQVPVGETFTVARILEQMVKNHQIQKTGDFYHLPGRSTLVSRRLKRAKLSSSQLVRARVLANKLGHIKGVLAIYLTGSLAMSNSVVGSDIDFMIITGNNRLWTTRVLLTLYTELLGLRRHPRKPPTSGKLCLNLYLTPSSYTLPQVKQSLYTAYELIQAVPLYDPHNTHSALLSANSWIKSYLPNVVLGSDLAPRTDSKGFMKIIEKIAYQLQLLYMRPKLTREYITPDSAFFHPNNPAPKV